MLIMCSCGDIMNTQLYFYISDFSVPVVNTMQKASCRDVCWLMVPEEREAGHQKAGAGSSTNTKKRE